MSPSGPKNVAPNWMNPELRWVMFIVTVVALRADDLIAVDDIDPQRCAADQMRIRSFFGS
jgi:hypothetical protein